MSRSQNHNLQIKRIEENHHVFSFVVTEGDILELPIYNSSRPELGSRLLQLWHRHFENWNIQTSNDEGELSGRPSSTLVPLSFRSQITYPMYLHCSPWITVLLEKLILS
jgi:hypothetical protein